MKPERWQEIEQLYHTVLKQDASERAAFLKEACGGDAELRREVESLLARQSEAESFVETPAAKVVAEVQGHSLVGQQIGSYKILSLLGAGGMGQVYRAKDAKLGREVAIKVLPREFSTDADRVRRFEQEARAASALNHPNIITIYEMGQSGSMVYMAMELVEGKTLREILGSESLPTKKVLQLATQIADGLAKAHAAGITHRDLKPENLMITKDGLVKILDFGLAKQTVAAVYDRRGSESALTERHYSIPTEMESLTEPGIILGTVGYMSPEQAKGEAVNFQSDQFSFGAIIYEMVTGKRAFARGSAAETLWAIIREEPEALAAANPKAPVPLRWVIERCLAKDPRERYGSTWDLAQELQRLPDHLLELSSAEPTMVSAPPVGVRRFKIMRSMGLAAILLAVLLLIFFWQSRIPSPPTFHRLTFRHGNITGARFAADGQTVVYGASFGGKPSELYTTRSESPESRSLGLQDAGIFSISPSGEMAIALKCSLNWSTCIGTLAQVPLAGGAPKEIMEDVHCGDWSPDGRTLAVVRQTKGRISLEYPLGKVLYETTGWILGMRISPRGDQIAFLDNPILGDPSGSVCLMDLTGKKKDLSTGWKSLGFLAWSPVGDEIWFSGTREGRGGGLAVYAVTSLGKERVILNSPSSSRLEDMSRDGRRVLLTRQTPRAAMIGLTPSTPKEERDLAWFDYSTVADLSRDGKTLLFYEWGEGVRGTHTVYLRKTDGSDAVRMGEGKPLALSPDGRWAAVLQEAAPQQLVLLPTGPGEPKLLPRGPLQEYLHWAAWSPDGSRIFFAGAEPRRLGRTYVQDVAGGEPRPVTPEGMVGALLSPDGKWIAAFDRYREYYLCPVEGGEPHAIEGFIEDDLYLLQWSSDGRSLFVRGAGDLVLRIYKLDLASGRRELWKELRPPDPAPLIGVALDPGQVRITPDGKYYVYTSWTQVAELFLAEGLR